MDLLFCTHQQYVKAVIAEEFTFQTLLRQGLESLRHGNIDEAISLLAQARAQLTLEQMHLASILDKIVEGYTAYFQLHEALLQAERNVAKADSEQQTLLATVSKLLLASKEANNNGQDYKIQPDENSPYDQSFRDRVSHQSLVPSQSHARNCDALPGLPAYCSLRGE